MKEKINGRDRQIYLDVLQMDEDDEKEKKTQAVDYTYNLHVISIALMAVEC